MEKEVSRSSPQPAWRRVRWALAPVGRWSILGAALQDSMWLCWLNQCVTPMYPCNPSQPKLCSSRENRAQSHPQHLIENQTLKCQETQSIKKTLFWAFYVNGSQTWVIDQSALCMRDLVGTTLQINASHVANQGHSSRSTLRDPSFLTDNINAISNLVLRSV